MGRTLALLALVISSIGPVPCARADGPVVLARLPVERHDEMMAALRLELAGRAEVVDGAAVEDDMTTGQLREEAGAAGATHVVWIAFPGGALRPAEVRVLRLDRSAAAHAMTPQAWDVVDARLVAVIAGSLMDAGPSEPVGVVGTETATDTAPATETETLTATETATATETETETLAATETATAAETANRTELEAGAASSDPAGPLTLAPTGRPARTFSLLVGLGFGHRTWADFVGPEIMTQELAFYGRISEIVSLGLRLHVGHIGYDSISGLIIGGSISGPSFAISGRVPLGTAATLELGAHADPGLYFYGFRASEWSFGIGLGAFATLELGAANGLRLDYTLDVFGFEETGPLTWGIASLAYVHRFD